MKTTHPIKAYTGGIHALMEAAVNSRGECFIRHQDKTRWGYRWTAWKSWKQFNPDNLPNSIEAGFSTLWRAGEYSNWQNWRIPA